MPAEMSNRLPKGWIECEMGDIAMVVGGGTPDSQNFKNFSMTEGFPWLTPADLSEHKPIYVAKGKRFLSDEGLSSSSARLMPKGTVLFSSRAPIGYVAVAANEVSTNQGFKSFVCTNGISPEYIYFWLRFAKPMAEELASGTTFAEISGKNAAKIPLRLPPLNEQRRIAAKLEKLLSRVEACKDRLEKIPAILKRFRQTVLAAACSGRLTAEWREKNPEVGALPENGSNKSATDIPLNWKTLPFSDLITSIRSGSTAVPSRVLTDYPILRSSSVRKGFVDLEDVTYLNKEQSQNARCYLSDGDLLFTRLSGSLEYVANCALVSGLNGRKIQFPDRIFCAKVKSINSARFLEISFGSPQLRESLVRGAKSSAGHQRVSMSTIEEQLIRLPPLPEQHEIVRRVDDLFKIADRIVERYRKAKTFVDKLTQSILAKAFRGELAPQDPNDEPASVLLERIRAERVSRKPGGRSRKR